MCERKIVGADSEACFVGIFSHSVSPSSFPIPPSGSPLYARKGLSDWLEKNIEILNLCVLGDITVGLPGLPFTGWHMPGWFL